MKSSDTIVRFILEAEEGWKDVVDLSGRIKYRIKSSYVDNPAKVAYVSRPGKSYDTGVDNKNHLIWSPNIESAHAFLPKYAQELATILRKHRPWLNIELEAVT